MAKLVFDIETSGLPLDHFDAVQQEYLFREAENLPDPAARAAKRDDILRQFSLWPATGKVVCIAMVNADSLRGKVLFLREDCAEEAGPKWRGGLNSSPAPARDNWWRSYGTWRCITIPSLRFTAGGFDVPFVICARPF